MSLEHENTNEYRGSEPLLPQNPYTHTHQGGVYTRSTEYGTQRGLSEINPYTHVPKHHNTTSTRLNGYSYARPKSY